MAAAAIWKRCPAAAMAKVTIPRKPYAGHSRSAAPVVRDVSLESHPGGRVYTLNVSKPHRPSEPSIPPVVEELSRQTGIARLEWRCLD